MRVGDTVKVIGVPTNVHNDDEFRTRIWFEKCLGKTFTVAGLEAVAGLPFQLIQLDVGHVLGQPSYMHTICVEPEYLEPVLDNVIQP